METKRIKVILSALENKSFSKAAEVFSYTPSALSHMADSLEEELGVRIIDRTPQGIALTKEGEFLYNKLIKIVDAEHELTLAAKRLSEESACVLRIGAYSSISTNVLPKILKPFKEQHPEVIVSISVRDSLKGWLDEGKADVIFADDVGLRNQEAIYVIEDPFVAVLPKDSLPNRNSITRDELYSYTYISTNQSVLRTYLDEDRFADILHFDSVDDQSVISMVKEGLGIAILPKLSVKKERRSVQVLRLSPGISRMLGFAYKADTTQRSATGKFISFLKTQRDLFEGIMH